MRTRLVRIMSGALASAALCGIAIGCGHSYAADDPVVVDAGDASSTPADGASGDGEAGRDAAMLVDAGIADARDSGRSLTGCADGTREDFPMNKSIAGCQGAWSVPGAFADGGPRCGRAAGNDAIDTTGTGCGTEDLCAAGWHVCVDHVDVATHGGATGGLCSSTLTTGHTLFITAQPSQAAAMCDPSGSTGTNDVFGCGDVGNGPSLSCAPLNAAAGTNTTMLGTFVFGADGAAERANVIKGPGLGGVLCCSD